jgi:hypothetical protein
MSNDANEEVRSVTAGSVVPETVPGGLASYDLTFTNGALDNLRKLSSRLGNGDDLDATVDKAIKLLGLFRDLEIEGVETKKGDRYKINLDKL